MKKDNTPPHTEGLNRQLGLIGLAATGICSMLGASIYVVPFMIQRHVPGIGPNVLPAFFFAALPAIFAAIAYAILSTAMPKAGGSYLYASRGLHPYLGFIASFSQWFGLSIAIGVISYIIIPFFRDIADAMDWQSLSSWLGQGSVRVILALVLLWFFVGINLLGIRSYEKIVIPLMIVMFGLGAIVVIAVRYTDKLSYNSLLLALCSIFLLIALNRSAVRNLIAYGIAGLILWVCVLKSGVHATLAGVIMAFAIPLRDPVNPEQSPVRSLEDRINPHHLATLRLSNLSQGYLI